MKSKPLFLGLVVFIGCMTGSMLSGASPELPNLSNHPGETASTQVHRLPSQESTPHAGSQTRSYGQREAAAQDLRNFAGGQEVVIFTPYDYHILAGLLLIAAIVLIVILI